MLDLRPAHARPRRACRLQHRRASRAGRDRGAAERAAPSGPGRRRLVPAVRGGTHRPRPKPQRDPSLSALSGRVDAGRGRAAGPGGRSALARRTCPRTVRLRSVDVRWCNWTVVSAALLLVPTILLGVLVQHPGAPYWLMFVAAATAGFGGGNFASSMANISYFYPDARKGLALGLNAAGGNIGVAFVQFAVPAVIGLGVLGLGASKVAHPSLQWAGLLWVPFIVAAVACAYLFMDNLAVARASLREQAIILRRKHTWAMSWLYIGTFGSFIGYSAALPLLIKVSFPHVNPLQFAFLGPLVGSLARPLGGWLSDRLGGATVTFWNFLVMLAATGGVIVSLGARTAPWGFAGFLTMFLVLFVTTGIGNGSTFRMVPAIFQRDRLL